MNPLISALLGPLMDVLGKLIADPEKRSQAQLDMLKMAQAGELEQLQAAASVVLAEAQGNFLQRTWRPCLMIFFAGLIGARWWGYTPPHITESELMRLWDIVYLGIGGYTIGRSAEKIAPLLGGIFKK